MQSSMAVTTLFKNLNRGMTKLRYLGSVGSYPNKLDQNVVENNL